MDKRTVARKKTCEPFCFQVQSYILYMLPREVTCDTLKDLSHAFYLAFSSKDCLSLWNYIALLIFFQCHITPLNVHAEFLAKISSTPLRCLTLNSRMMAQPRSSNTSTHITKAWNTKGENMFN